MSSQRLVERFLGYVRMHTTSSEQSESAPTTECQLAFQESLAEELRELGLENVEIGGGGVLYASLPEAGPMPESCPTIVLIAHVDTSPEAPGDSVSPLLHEHWNGEPIVLPGDPSMVIDPADTRDMPAYVGDTIITSDGTTLLGADDKAGVAIIVSACERLLRDASLPRPRIRVAFTPDEEVGRGVVNFDVEGLGGDFAYTVDGGPLGSIDSQTFNAHRVDWMIEGRQVHPGSAKDVMINAVRIASRLVCDIRAEQMPESSSGMEGYIYPLEIEGNCSTARVRTIVRDFTSSGMEQRLEYLRSLATHLEKSFPGCRVSAEFREQYRNPGEVIAEDRRPVEYALEGFERAGIPSVEGAIRGGTDGSRLSRMGLPTVNLPTGGELYHSKREWIAVGGMKAALEGLLSTLAVWRERSC